ncbi:MAG: amino acid synthesis family protein [Desulfobacteraceae bacterium]
MQIIKYVTIVEEIHTDSGRPVDPPGRRAAAIAVIESPFAGKFADDLTSLMDIGEALGGIFGKMAVDALGILPDRAESYGKAAIVGPLSISSL